MPRDSSVSEFACIQRSSSSCWSTATDSTTTPPSLRNTQNAAYKAGYKMTYSKSADGNHLWTVDARAEPAVMAFLNGTNARIVRTDLKVAEAELAMEAERVKGALGFDAAGLGFPPALAPIPEPAPASQFLPAAGGGAGAGGGFFSSLFSQPAAPPAAAQPQVQPLAPRELFTQRQPAAAAKKDKGKAPAVGRANVGPPPLPPAVLRPPPPAPNHPAGWFGILSAQQQQQYLENQARDATTLLFFSPSMASVSVTSS